MNPDTGRLHEVAKIAGVDKIVPPRKEQETAEQAIKRAAEALEARIPDSEPFPGTDVPEGWPRFNVGDEVGPGKGWWLRVEGVDVQAQTIALKPSRKAGSKPRPVSAKRRRKRRRGR